MIDLREIRSVTDFQRNAREYVDRLKSIGSPMVLTVNGQAELVVQNAAGYQELLDRLEELEAVSAIRAGLEDVKDGRTKPARKAMKDLESRLAIRR